MLWELQDTPVDKEWMTPNLKVQLRKVQQELFKCGKTNKYKALRRNFRRQKKKAVKSFYKNFVEDLKSSKPGNWFNMLKKLGGTESKVKERVQVESLEGLTDQEAVEEVAGTFAAVSQSYKPCDTKQLPSYLPAGRPEALSVFQVLEKLKTMKKTRSTLPIDLPDQLRIECAVDLAEPLTDIFNSCFENGVFPIAWRREWVTALPKPNRELKTCSDLRKIASTSDYSKLFEKFLMKFVIEDIGLKIDPHQFAAKKGVGTEHLLVAMMDRVLGLLDKPGMTAVVRAAADWASAFDRTDPTKSIQKFIKMGVRSSIVPILMQFLTDRKMSVKFNNAESKMYSLIGGGPQGSQTGQETYIVASDDSAYHVPLEDRFKFCDDVSILEVVMLGDVLTEYDCTQHVPSDVGVDQLFLDPQQCRTPENLATIATWTKENLMQLNEAKSEYQIFTRSHQSFATRFSINNKVIERKQTAKVLGVWLQSDGSWTRNTSEICKRAYAKIGMLTKLKYAGTKSGDLIQIYKLFVRSTAEYACVAFHSNLGSKNSAAIEKIQSTSLRVIFPSLTYKEAMAKAGLETMAERRHKRCLDFSLKAIKHPQMKSIFPINQHNLHNIRNHEKFKVNHAYNNFYRDSAVPFCQRLLNQHFSSLEGGGQERRRRGEEGEERRGERGRGGGEEEERRRRGRGA